MRCLWCHRDVEAGWAVCPDCGGELVADPTATGAFATYRPAGTKAFDPFVIASVRHVSATGPLVLFGAGPTPLAPLAVVALPVVCAARFPPVVRRTNEYRGPVPGALDLLR